VEFLFIPLNLVHVLPVAGLPEVEAHDLERTGGIGESDGDVFEDD